METCKKYVRLHDLIKHIRIAMLTTVEDNGCLRSMPMTTMKTECEGFVWFFTNFDSQKVEEILNNNCVNVSYADPSSDIYVSITGHAEITRDKNKMDTLWKPNLCEWFPRGLEDPDLALLKIHIKEAEYWDRKEGKMTQVWEMANDAVRVNGNW